MANGIAPYANDMRFDIVQHHGMLSPHIGQFIGAGSRRQLSTIMDGQHFRIEFVIVVVAVGGDRDDITNGYSCFDGMKVFTLPHDCARTEQYTMALFRYHKSIQQDQVIDGVRQLVASGLRCCCCCWIHFVETRIRVRFGWHDFRQFIYCY